VISADAVLLTYRTERLADGKPPRHVLRSSIWKRTDAGWKMLFHQGTPTDACSQTEKAPDMSGAFQFLWREP
jgi:hypothetical protein